MDTTGCPAGLFTDNVIGLGQHCASQTLPTFILVPILEVLHFVVASAAVIRWIKKNTGRGRMRQAGRPRYEYFFRRRLPIMPTCLVLIFLTSFLFWVLTMKNVIDYSDGGTLALFALHIFLAFVAMKLHLFKFVRLGRRIKPIATRSRESDSEPQTTSGSRDTFLTESPIVLYVLFSVCVLSSFLALIISLIGAPLVEGDKTWVLEASGSCFAIASAVLLGCFYLQIHRTIVGIERLKNVAVASSRQGDLAKLVEVLRKHRIFATVTLLALVSVSCVLAGAGTRPWYLFYLADVVVVTHTLMIWIDEVIYMRQRGRSRTFTQSPRLGLSPQIDGISRKRPTIFRSPPKAVPKSPPGVIAINRSTPSPKSKVSPLLNSGGRNAHIEQPERIRSGSGVNEEVKTRD